MASPIQPALRARAAAALNHLDNADTRLLLEQLNRHSGDLNPEGTSGTDASRLEDRAAHAINAYEDLLDAC